MRPAAEDGVGETRTALGAPYQLHQLFGQFGHDGVPASGSLLSGFLPRNMGKGRFWRQQMRNGSGQAVGRLNARKTKGETYKQGPRLSSRVGAAARSFPYRKCPSLFRLLLRYRPHIRRARNRLPGSGWGLGRAGPLREPEVFLSSVSRSLREVVAFVLAGTSPAIGCGLFLTSLNTSSLRALLWS